MSMFLTMCTYILDICMNIGTSHISQSSQNLNKTFRNVSTTIIALDSLSLRLTLISTLMIFYKSSSQHHTGHCVGRSQQE